MYEFRKLFSVSKGTDIREIEILHLKFVKLGWRKYCTKHELTSFNMQEFEPGIW